jgi:hypothetical protein
VRTREAPAHSRTSAVGLECERTRASRNNRRSGTAPSARRLPHDRCSSNTPKVSCGCPLPDRLAVRRHPARDHDSGQYGLGLRVALGPTCSPFRASIPGAESTPEKAALASTTGPEMHATTSAVSIRLTLSGSFVTWPDLDVDPGHLYSREVRARGGERHGRKSRQTPWAILAPRSVHSCLAVKVPSRRR